jgi:hypothetical protein
MAVPGFHPCYGCCLLTVPNVRHLLCTPLLPNLATHPRSRPPKGPFACLLRSCAGEPRGWPDRIAENSVHPLGKSARVLRSLLTGCICRPERSTAESKGLLVHRRDASTLLLMTSVGGGSVRCRTERPRSGQTVAGAPRNDRCRSCRRGVFLACKLDATARDTWQDVPAGRRLGGGQWSWCRFQKSPVWFGPLARHDMGEAAVDRAAAPCAAIKGTLQNRVSMKRSFVEHVDAWSQADCVDSSLE